MRVSPQHLWDGGREVMGVLQVPGGEGHGVCPMSAGLLDNKQPWPAIHESNLMRKRAADYICVIFGLERWLSS